MPNGKGSSVLCLAQGVLRADRNLSEGLAAGTATRLVSSSLHSQSCALKGVFISHTWAERQILKTVEAELELKSVPLWNVCPCPPLHCTQFILPLRPCWCAR